VESGKCEETEPKGTSVKQIFDGRRKPGSGASDGRRPDLGQNQTRGRKPDNKARPKERLGVPEVEVLLRSSGDSLDNLFQRADRARREGCGQDVYLFGVIGLSNYGAGRCYCGALRLPATGSDKYRMDPEEAIEVAKLIPADRMGTVLLESGEDPEFSIDKIRLIISGIKRDTSLTVAVSAGERSLEEYRKLEEDGADYILLHQETTNWVLYGILNRARKLEERKAALQSVQDAGFPVWTGGLVGPAGQSLQGMAEDIVSYAKMKAGLVNVVPFVPSPGEGLGQAPGAGLGLLLKAVAVTRIVNPKALMPVCFASTAFHPNVWRLALGVGANVLVADLTPRKYRKGEITSQAFLQDGETLESLVGRASREIDAAGRKLARTPETKTDE